MFTQLPGRVACPSPRRWSRLQSVPAEPEGRSTAPPPEGPRGGMRQEAGQPVGPTGDSGVSVCLKHAQAHTRVYVHTYMCAQMHTRTHAYTTHVYILTHM